MENNNAHNNINDININKKNKKENNIIISNEDKLKTKEENINNKDINNNN